MVDNSRRTLAIDCSDPTTSLQIADEQWTAGALSRRSLAITDTVSFLIHCVQLSPTISMLSDAAKAKKLQAAKRVVAEVTCRGVKQTRKGKARMISEKVEIPWRVFATVFAIVSAKTTSRL